MATINNDNAPSSGSGKSSVNTQENTSTTNTNDSTSSISSSGIESLSQDNNKSDLSSSSESLKTDESNDRFETLWQGAEQAGIVKDAPGERKEVSAEQLYFESLKGNAGKSSQDLAFEDLIKSKKIELYRLESVYRQGEGSSIIINSNKIKMAGAIQTDQTVNDVIETQCIKNGSIKYDIDNCKIIRNDYHIQPKGLRIIKDTVRGLQ